MTIWTYDPETTTRSLICEFIAGPGRMYTQEEQEQLHRTCTGHIIQLPQNREFDCQCQCHQEEENMPINPLIAQALRDGGYTLISIQEKILHTKRTSTTTTCGRPINGHTIYSYESMEHMELCASCHRVLKSEGVL